MSGQRPVAQQADEGHDQRHHQAQYQQRCGPAQPLDKAESARQHCELAERTGSAGNAHGHAALFRRHSTPDHAEDDRERGAGQTDTDQQAGTQRQRPGRVGHAHQHQPGSVENTANDHHPRRTHAVGQGAGERLRQPPDQVLQGNGEGKHLTPQPKSALIGARNRPKPCRTPRDSARISAAPPIPTRWFATPKSLSLSPAHRKVLRVYTRL